MSGYSFHTMLQYSGASSTYHIDKETGVMVKDTDESNDTSEDIYYFNETTGRFEVVGAKQDIRHTQTYYKHPETGIMTPTMRIEDVEISQDVMQLRTPETNKRYEVAKLQAVYNAKATDTSADGPSTAPIDDGGVADASTPAEMPGQTKPDDNSTTQEVVKREKVAHANRHVAAGVMIGIGCVVFIAACVALGVRETRRRRHAAIL